MSELDKAYQAQLDNIQRKTGKTLADLEALVKSSGLSKHGELRDMLKRDLGLGHGDANALVHAVLQSDGGRAAQGLSVEDVLHGIYIGPKAGLRPVHDAVLSAVTGFGDFENAPKKGYVSLRRKRQFAMVGPATNTQVEIGINARGLTESPRLKPQPAGSMCNYKVRLAAVSEVDAELVGWLRTAYESAG